MGGFISTVYFEYDEKRSTKTVSVIADHAVVVDDDSGNYGTMITLGNPPYQLPLHRNSNMRPLVYQGTTYLYINECSIVKTAGHFEVQKPDRGKKDKPLYIVILTFIEGKDATTNGSVNVIKSQQATFVCARTLQDGANKHDEAIVNLSPGGEVNITDSLGNIYLLTVDEKMGIIIR